MSINARPDPPLDPMAPLEEIREDLASLVRQVHAQVLAGRYGAFIADDTSGRVPAIVVRHACNHLGRRAGLPALPMYFLPGGGGRQGHQRDAEAAYVELSPLIRRAIGDRRVLFVTDYAATGATVRQFIDTSAALDIPADVAVVRASWSAGWMKSRGLLQGWEVFIGGDVRRQPLIDGNHDFSGVNKFPATVLRGEPAVTLSRQARRHAEAIARQFAEALR
jgi:hypothetical protein